MFKRVPYLVAVLLLVLAPLGSVDLFELQLIVVYATVVVGLNLAIGYADQHLFGHAAIVGAAAYTAALLDSNLQWDGGVTLVCSIAVAMFFGLVIGLPGLRISGLYLGLASFFGVLVLANVVRLFPEQTGGDDGLVGIRPLQIISPLSEWVVYEICVVGLLVCLWGLRNLVTGGWGVRLRALRDAPYALETNGLSVSRTKLVVYVLSAVPAGFAGWMLCYINLVVSPAFFGLSLTFLLIAAAEVGGKGTLLGPVIAVFVLQGYSVLVGQFSPYSALGMSLLLLIALWLTAGPGQTLVAKARVVLSTLGSRATQHDSLDRISPPAIARTPFAVESGTTFEGPVLAIENVGKTFGGNQALEDVSLMAGRGEVLGLVGGNGSGKTTLVNIATGVLRADTGEVRVLGKTVSNLPSHRIARMGLSRTFQVPQLVPELTAQDNVQLALLNSEKISLGQALLHGQRFRGTERRRLAAAREACALLGMSEEVMTTPAEQLSLGMRRVVEVARAVAGGAAVVCLDEPAAGLNFDEIERLGDALVRLRELGVTVVLIEHNVRFVLSVCDRVVLLENGRIAAEFRPTADEAVPADLERFLGFAPGVGAHDPEGVEDHV